MGFLRLFLALTILISHFAAIEKFGTLISGALAVRVFYLISDFYIQFIIAQYDRQPHWIRNFYSSRVLRIFPAYYLLAVLTMWQGHFVCSSFCMSMVINHRLPSLVFYFTSNLFIVGQVVGRFLSYHYTTGLFSFDPDTARPAEYWASNLQVLGQSWSIGIELWFYLFAPFILKRRTSDLLMLAALSFAVRCSLILHGHDNTNTWYSSFFPSELYTFLLGALTARIAASGRQFEQYLSTVGMVLLFIWIIRPEVRFPDHDELFIFGIFCLLPLVFRITRDSRVDLWIGELSYPIYLNHILVMNFLAQYIMAPLPLLAACVASSIVFSIVIVLCVDHPISRFRHRRFRRTHREEDEAATLPEPEECEGGLRPVPVRVFRRPRV